MPTSTMYTFVHNFSYSGLGHKPTTIYSLYKGLLFSPIVPLTMVYNLFMPNEFDIWFILEHSSSEDFEYCESEDCCVYDEMDDPYED